VDALVCMKPGILEIQQRPEPVRQPGHVLVRPRRIGICGTDYHIFEGTHPFLQYPRVMGHELSVEVVEAASDSGFAPGEILVVNPYLSCGRCIACRTGKPNCCANVSVLGVHQDGGMTGFLSLPAHNLLHAEGLSPEACATVEFLAIGAHAVRRGAISPNERVLVVGCGPIGLGVAIFAGIAGAKVSVLDTDTQRLASAQQIAGAEALETTGDILDAVCAATGGDKFDVVLDATGNQDSLHRGFDYVAHGGRYVFVSVVTGDITFSDPDFHKKEMTLLGSRNATNQDFESVITAIRDSRVPIGEIVTHRTTLAGAAIDLPIWAAQKDGLIKALIELN